MDKRPSLIDQAITISEEDPHLFDGGNVAFINTSDNVSDTEMSNAVTNMYNNSPRFQLMMDKLNDTNAPVMVIIGDGPRDGHSDIAQTAINTPTDKDEQARNVDLHFLRE